MACCKNKPEVMEGFLYGLGFKGLRVKGLGFKGLGFKGLGCGVLF